MDRGAWQGTVHRVVRLRHDLATKPPPLEAEGKVGPHSHHAPRCLAVPDSELNQCKLKCISLNDPQQ